MKDEWKKYVEPIIEVASFYPKNSEPDFVETVMVTVEEVKNRELILVIDDDMTFISYLKKVLEGQGYAVFIAHNGKRGMELIYELKPSIVFVDDILPDMNGFSIVKNIRKIRKENLFIAVMSVNDNRENRKLAYDLGAIDFIPKPIDEELIVSYVNNRVAYKKDFEYSSLIDELTQVYNRRFMNIQLQQMIQQYMKDKEIFSFAVLDLDYFKKINDVYGHIMGDEILKEFADFVMTSKREQDIFCRYGGEEFAYLMPQTDGKEGQNIIEELRELVAQKVFNRNDKDLNMTFSAGVVEAGATNLSIEKMLEESDYALYLAKQAGRNNVKLFDGIEERTQKRIKIKIIVIDDVFIIRNLITSYFENWESNESFDVEVMAFNDGVSFLQTNWYHEDYKYIILLDGVMPSMDGIEVLKSIRENYTSRDVIVSMLTVRNDEKNVLEALENGADDYIIKPFDIADVSSRIISLINRLFIGEKIFEGK